MGTLHQMIRRKLMGEIKSMKILLEKFRGALRDAAFLLLGAVALLAATCQGAQGVVDPTPTPVAQVHPIIGGQHIGGCK